MQKVDSTGTSRLDITVTTVFCETTNGLITILHTVILVVQIIASLEPRAVCSDWR
jgi:hypothetical protein